MNILTKTDTLLMLLSKLFGFMMPFFVRRKDTCSKMATAQNLNTKSNCILLNQLKFAEKLFRLPEGTKPFISITELDILRPAIYAISSSSKKLILFLALNLILLSSFSQTQIFTSTGTYTVPAGVTKITVECWGGGGAGGGTSSWNLKGGGGGAGGSYVRSTLTVVPGTDYTVSVASVTTGSYGDGSTGFPSYFGSTATIYAQGGEGGARPANATVSGGIGSTTLSIGDIKYAGGNGANGTTSLSGGGGGGAGSTGIGGNAFGTTGGLGTSSDGGNGANGRTNEGNGSSGNIAGGGGSGAYVPDGTNHSGGSGAGGRVVVVILPPDVALSSPTPVALGIVSPGSINNPIYSFATSVSNGDATITSVNFTTVGTYVSNDISNFKLWYNSVDDFTSASQIGSDITTSLGAGLHTFSGLAQVVNTVTTGYFWISSDISATGIATIGSTISVNSFAPTNLVSGFATITGSALAGEPQTILTFNTYYSYQSGFWNQASTWTSDPGGTTGPGTTVPSDYDKVVILSGRTVTLQEDNNKLNLDININNGGIIDQSTFKFINTLAALRGSGVLKLQSDDFPQALTNSFVSTDRGTTEYNINGPISALQSLYYHLTINTAGTATQVSNISLNGDLKVKKGVFQINDNTVRRLQLVINGNVSVDNTGAIAVGSGKTNSQTSPIGIDGNTGLFLNYYELQSHRVQIYGDFTNNGTVRFSNRTFPVYNQLADNGFATVYFQGLSDNTLTCNGQTDFYNLVVDKGTSQTFKLNINSSAYTNFRLFGANTSGGSTANPVSTSSNPNLRKALWIKNGTLALQGLLAIPSLSEGNTGGGTGTLQSDFIIPANASMLLDGAGVIVLATADDYTEVNAAYGLVGGSNAIYGILAFDGYSGISIFGKLQIDEGYLSTRESAGLLYWSYAPGHFILNGGKIDAKQLHNPERGSNGLLSYSQRGGDMVLRGRFQNVIAYVNPADLSNTTINTVRATNSIDTDGSIGTFSINNNPANAYAMTGGNISIYDVCNTSATALAFLVNCPGSNINVSGGVIQIVPTNGTVQANANYFINSTAAINNLIINRVSGTASVQLSTNPLLALNDLTLTSGVFIANNLDVSIGGDFTIESGTSYFAGSNTTTFNGSRAQTFTVNAAAPLSLYKLTINKTTGVDFNFAGTQSTINVSNDFRLVLGTLNDNGNAISIAGNVYNSGILAGTGKAMLNGTSIQTIDGNGIFGNLELNNTNAAAAPVSLLANVTVNGLLTFSQNKIFNIDTYNLRLNSNASLVNAGSLRYIRTSGNSGDGGLTRVYSSATAFVFPLGAPTLIPARAAKYTPATIGFSSDPTTFGSITVVPVGYEHPATTVNGQNLTYFWIVKSSGFIGIAAGSVTHSFVYDQTDVVGTESNYIPSLFDRTLITWNSGQATDINTGTNVISDWAAPTIGTNYLDADYTAGDASFGVPTIYYSRQSGSWASPATWSLTSHTVTNPPATPPDVNDIVIIGNSHSILLNAIANCATLKIETGSTLDLSTYTGSVFSMVLSHPSGNGLFRLTTTPTPNNVPKLFSFPSNSDFSDFNNNQGTTEYYDIDGTVGALYILPPNVTTYGNLILTAKGGDNIVLPNNALTTIKGNLTCGGNNPDAWIAVSWNTNIAPYNSGVYNPTIEKTVHITGDLNVNTGTLIFMPEIVPQHLVIDGNFIVGTDGYIDVQPAVYGVPTGAPVPNNIAIGGNLINNSNGGSYVRLRNAGYYCDLIFQGPNNASISGTSPNTIFNKVTVNKGNSQAATLNLNFGGILTTPADNWLTLQNGTFIYNRTNPNGDFTISTTTLFEIPSTAGLEINLPSNTWNSNILIGNSNNNDGDLLLGGKLTIISGDVYIGQTAGTDNSNNDIEYTGSGTSTIDIQGGTLMVNGQIRRNPLNAGGILNYTQSGGAVKINGQNSNTTNAKLEILNNGSQFNMSNGTLSIGRGNGSLTTASTPVGDLYIRPQTGTVTGGTIIFTNTGVNAPQNYFLESNIPLFNLSISGTSATNYSEVRILTSPLKLNGNMTINANSVLNSNNINITFNGNLTNTPGIAGYVYGTNTTTFNASVSGALAGAQSITGATNFYNLIVSPAATLTLVNPVTVFKDLTLSTGILACVGNAVTLEGNLTNNSSYTDNNAVGSGIILKGTSLQQITGLGAYSRLTINNAAGVQINNDISLQEDLTMTLGILDIKRKILSLGVNSNILGAPFSSTKMIITDGVYSKTGLEKFFNAGATTFLYPLGTRTKYTPAVLTLTANNSVGSLRINNISSYHPTILDPSNALKYYWETESAGLSGVSGNLLLNYLQEDVFGDEVNYLATRLIVPWTSWSKTTDNDAATNTIKFNYVTSNNLSGEYGAGTDSAYPDEIPVYTSNKDGNWTDKTIWDQTYGDFYPCPDGGPNGFIVNVNHVVKVDANNCSAYITTINNELRIVAPYYGHNLGTVRGSGKLYLEKGNFPAGVFTTFLSCSYNATIEYGGTGDYTIISDLFNSIPNIVFSGTGTRGLPNKDLTICNRLVIDGPALDNSLSNMKLIIQGSMERYNTGTFISGLEVGASVSFAGDGPQTIGGSLGDFTGSNSFNNFEINNASGLTVNDGGAIEITSKLYLTNGLIETGAARKLTITNTAINSVVPEGGNSNSFVNGPLIKMINQFDSFLYPIGTYSFGRGVLGNRLKISSTQTGPLLWTAEYKSPNSTSNEFTAPLLGVSAQEYYTIGVNAGSQSKLSIDWNSASDINPITASGVSSIRLANYNSGSSKWDEIPTTPTGDNYNGTAFSTGIITYSGANDYTLASIIALIPRARLNPSGPVCGNGGIPVSFITLNPIPFDYILNYTLDLVAQAPDTITSADVPYSLPTPDPGRYKLTGFTYNNGSIGVVDTTGIRVYPVPTTANAGTDQTSCSITTTLLEGNTAIIGSGLWSIVSGTGGTIMSPTSPTSQFIGSNGASYTLRWTITSGTCQSMDDVIINFTILPDAPTADPDQYLCNGSTVADLIAIPPVGCTVDWYTAASGGSLLDPVTPLVSGTTYYGESNGGCLSLSRTASTATLSTGSSWLGSTSTDWDTASNWCGGVPISGTDVIIPYVFNQPLISSSAICRDLVIDAGAILTTSAVGDLTVEGILTNNNGAAGLVLQSDASGTASLIHSTNGILATVERYIGGAAEDWHFLSSPVSNQSISGSWLPAGNYGNGTGYDLYLWNEPTFCWIYQLNTTSDTTWIDANLGTDFIAGRGYLYSVEALNPTKEFVGSLNNGSLSYGLTIDAANSSLNGFNLVGNPYPSSIDWLSAIGWTRTNLESSGAGYDMWIWNPAEKNYGVCNSATGITTNFISSNIAPMQGFFVRASSAGNLSIDNKARVNTGAGSWFKNEKQENQNLSLVVKSDAGFGSDEVLLGFGYFENENGAAKLFSNVTTAPSLYLNSESKNLSVRYLTNTQENAVVPVMFASGINGKYSISCNSDLNLYETVLLHDRQMDYFHDLKLSNTYSFQSTTSDAANRFVLYFEPLENYSNNQFPVRIYTDGIQLIVDLTLIDKDTDIQVYNTMGSLLLQTKLQGKTEHKLNLNANMQILIVHAKNPDGSLSQKLLWGVK